jgi:hypothetical protein
MGTNPMLTVGAVGPNELHRRSQHDLVALLKQVHEVRASLSKGFAAAVRRVGA